MTFLIIDTTKTEKLFPVAMFQNLQIYDSAQMMETMVLFTDDGDSKNFTKQSDNSRGRSLQKAVGLIYQIPLWARIC